MAKRVILLVGTNWVILMKQIFCILIITSLLTIIGCSPQERFAPSPDTRKPLETETLGEVVEQVQRTILEDISYDWDYNGVEEKVQLWSSEDPTNTRHTEVTVNEGQGIDLTEQQNKLNGYIRFGGWVRLEADQQGLVVVFDGVNEEEPQEKEPAWHKHYAWVILGYKDDKLSLIFDSLNQPFLADNNYSFTYTGEGDLFTFVDNYTGLKAIYSIVMEDTYRKLYDPSKLSENGLNQIAPALHYNSIETIDLDGDGMDEVICTRYIPGFYLQHVLGLMSYIFKWRDGRYQLQKEVLFKSLTYAGSDAYRPGNPDIEVVQEMDINP